MLQKNGSIYKFKCSDLCGKTYIGETKRLLKTRIAEHFQKSRASAIYQHTSSCEYFQNDLTKKLAIEPNATPTQKSQVRQIHLQNHFRAIAYSSDYTKRTTIEALMISLYEPELNEQVFHKKTFLV